MERTLANNYRNLGYGYVEYLAHLSFIPIKQQYIHITKIQNVNDIKACNYKECIS